MQELFDRVAALERNAPTRNSSVTEGLFQFYGGKLLGMAGAVFEWIGSFDLTGPFRSKGSSTFEGPVSITGTLDVSAETTLRALVTLLNDLQVRGGAGKITLEGGISMVLENGTATFANGAQLRGSSGGATLDGGAGARMQISLGNAALISGDNSVSVEGTGTTIQGPSVLVGDAVFRDDLYAPNLPTAPIAGVPSGALVQDAGSGRIYVAL
jgi:hypothetical protein